MTLKHSYNSTIAEDPASGTPGGLVGPNEWNADHAVSGTSLQTLFNNAGSLTGMSGTSWDNTNLALTITGATVTTSNPILNLSQTWNNAGVTFTAIKLNVTNTASAAASEVFGFQVGGTDLFILQPNINAILSLGDSTTATALRVYNTVDTLNNPTNYERGVFDWTTTSNALTIGTQAGGTGTGRQVVFTSAFGTTLQLYKFLGNSGKNVFLGSDGNGPVIYTDSSNLQIYVNNAAMLSLAPSGNGGLHFLTADPVSWGGSIFAPDTGVSKVAAGVVGIGTGANASVAGFIQWGGQARVTADVTNATASLANATGLAVALAAGRTYSFEVQLSFTDAAAGGIQAAMVASGGLTATNIIYDGWIVDSGANGIKGNAQATSLGGVVASATTTGTAGHVTIYGIITVNVAGTINVQFAQNTSNGTATTIKRGSYLIVHDMP